MAEVISSVMSTLF